MRLHECRQCVSDRGDRLIPAVAKCPYYEGFRWAEPSYADLRRLMRHVYTNPGEARAKGERASARCCRGGRGIMLH